MRILAWGLACALVATRWRAFDDWRDRRKVRAMVAQVEAEAWAENAAFDRDAARCDAEAAKQREFTGDPAPRLRRDAKRAA